MFFLLVYYCRSCYLCPQIFFNMYCRKVTKFIKVVPEAQSRVSGYIIYERPELSIDLDELIMSAVRDKFTSSCFVNPFFSPSSEFVKKYSCVFQCFLDVESCEVDLYLCEGCEVDRSVFAFIYTTDNDCQGIFDGVCVEIKCKNKSSYDALQDVRFL